MDLGLQRALLMAVPARMVNDYADELPRAGGSLHDAYDFDRETPVDRLLLRLGNAADAVGQGQGGALDGVWLEPLSDGAVLAGPRDERAPGARMLTGAAMAYTDLRALEATEEGMRAWAAVVVEAARLVLSHVEDERQRELATARARSRWRMATDMARHAVPA